MLNMRHGPTTPAVAFVVPAADGSRIACVRHRSDRARQVKMKLIERDRIGGGIIGDQRIEIVERRELATGRPC
jgi:hypothetical protein